ncbi:MAG: rRNA methyltransferase, partial [Gammaproteobacteria bacterium]|nr:rRNA methyltransferase [Gammaproteobacteria bacterium]
TGVSPAGRSAGSASVSIPMTGDADSVNAAMAATILLFEARRQRI